MRAPEPPALYFSGIAPGVPLAANLRLINAAGEPVRMHIHPPSTPFFSMAVQKRGRVMPGMAEEVTVTFSGDELRYFTDAIRVHLPGGQNLRVPLHAFPAVSPLSFRGASTSARCSSAPSRGRRCRCAPPSPSSLSSRCRCSRRRPT